VSVGCDAPLLVALPDNEAAACLIIRKLPHYPADAPLLVAKHLVQDGSSISKGVEVLSRVNNDINCVFLRLLENPRLCDRSAIEIVSAGTSNSRSTSPTASSGGGKRERGSVHNGKLSHKRLA
jgi:hypothetical protein